MNLTKDEIVRAEILLKAQTLFKQFGLRKTTMDEIAAACGKAKSTLYHYFKSKDEVFDAVIHMELTSLRGIVKQKVEEKKSMQDKLTTYFIEFHKEVLNKANLYKVVKQEFINELVAHSYFNVLVEFEKSYIVRIIEDSFDSGEFKKLEKSEIPWFSEVLIAAFMGIVRYSLETDNGVDQDKLEQTAKFIIPGLFS
jgi:AcrR family transcriptional regulator